MTFQEFNKLEKAEAGRLLATTCGSATWQVKMLENFPFETEESLVKIAGHVWYCQCTEADWREAFLHHPKIGDVKNLAEKFPDTRDMAGSEQASVNAASAEAITQLARANELYEAKFNHIFIVFATGKSAAELLFILQQRSGNELTEELNIAMAEQLKITIQRFKKIINEGQWQFVKPSHLTTHILNTATGKPAVGLPLRLKHFADDKWQTLAQAVTNADGRVSELLPSEVLLSPGHYKMIFDTGHYFALNNIQDFFYPEVLIDFSITDASHYHVPLLLSPFGYSTYRGS
jgi:hydroxyisourate hydrolase